MKILLMTMLGMCLVGSLPAQGPADNPPAPRRTAEELDELLGPIALYPDALIAIVLPASAYPSDIVLAARYVGADGSPARVEEKSWDLSVKALVRYPDTLKWLDENLEWTGQVGDAFVEQPVEVMESIQRLRAKARELGNLVDTPQQRIVQDETDIRIIPAQPNYIYVPIYDPEVIYYQRPLVAPLLFFSVGYGVGSWLNCDFDWHRHRLYRGDWHGGWDYSRDRDRRGREDYYYINNNLSNSREWHPDTTRHHTQSRQFSERSSNVGSSPGRTLSRDSVVDDKREHHKGVAHPKALVATPQRGETVRKTEPLGVGKGEKGPSSVTLHDGKSGDNPPKGRVIVPKSDAPGMPGGGKKGNDSRDRVEHKKTGNEAVGVGAVDPRSKNEGQAKVHVETPKHDPPPGTEHRKSVDTPKDGEPKHKEAPKHEELKRKEVPKQQEVAKHEEPKRKEVPKQQEAAKHEEPKRKEVPKQQEVAKHEPPKHEADKSKEDPAKKKGKPDKKKDDDKDKKKDP